jgi:hypothetical protein
VSASFALNYINNGFGVVVEQLLNGRPVIAESGVYGDGTIVIANQYGPGVDGGYQVIVQQAFFDPSMQTTTPAVTDIDFGAVIRKARTALKTRPQCRSLISGPNGEDPLKLLDKLLKKNEIKKDSGETNFATTEGRGGEAKTRLSADFYTDPTVNGKTTAFGVSRTTAGAITILHELAHATAKYSHTNGRPAFKYYIPSEPPGGDVNSPGTLNDRIARACFG